MSEHKEIEICPVCKKLVPVRVYPVASQGVIRTECCICGAILMEKEVV